ncbi:MAG: HAD family phosphatase [Clostridia bacterium]|nr:HAD family phosphatase [Clostridia bacterium]
MNLPSNIKYAIFDLDGTLFDSMWLWKQIDYDYLSKRGIQVPNDYMKCINHLSVMDTALYSIKRFNLKDSPQELIAEWLDMAKQAYCNKIMLKPYVVEFLQKLKSQNIGMAVATSLSKELALPALQRNGILQYFDTVVNSEQVTRGKGFPDIYLKAISHTHFKSCDCVVFEDILQGVKGAKKGDFYVVGVYDEESKSDHDEIKSVADKFINDFSELID